MIISCTGKQKFATFAQAERTAKRSRKGSNSERQRPYHCRYCNQFHIGRDVYTKAERGRPRVEVEA